MESFDFDNVKAEKAAATRRFKRQMKLKNLLFVLEVFMALVMLSWSLTYIPVVAEMATGFLHRFLVVFGKSLLVFVFVNVLILIITVLSKHKPTDSDMYDEYVSVTAADQGHNGSTEEKSPESKGVDCEKATVAVDNAENSAVEKNTVPTVTVVASESEPKHAVGTVKTSTAGAVTETVKYIRTQSERIDRDIRHELRRSETSIRRATAVVGRRDTARRSDAMEELSSEEFRRTIETFIASKKKTLIKENTLDFKPQMRRSCMAIAACN